MRLLPLLVFALVPSLALAQKQLKAKFVCKKVLKDQSAWEIGKEGYKIEAERINCTLSTRDKRAAGASALIHTTWSKDGKAQPGRDRLGEPNSEDGYEWYFTLEKGSDWDTCASTLTIPVTLTAGGEQVIFKSAETYKQDCAPIPVAPPVGSKAPTAPGAAWDEGALDAIPEAGRGNAQAFIDAAVDSDPPTRGGLASKGVKFGKKTLKSKDVYDLAPLGIKPQLGCEAGECQWGRWVTVNKGANEFWIYSRNESGYGAFSCAVFTRSGEEFRWTAVKTFDTGEP